MVFPLRGHIKLTIIAIKRYQWLVLAVAVLSALPLSSCSTDIEKRQTSMIQSEDGAKMNRAIWHKMSDEEKRAYARKSLLDIGENPDALVSSGRTREMLLLEGLEAVYAK